ncbi:UbiA family prenyltransferase [bacterium]|nr:UbiA family prenyltransferase [bacterium]
MSTLGALTKWRIATFNAASAAAGAVLAAPLAGSRLVWPVAGTFLLACGGAALNQIQERDEDARMVRTRHRPLPAGRISLTAALLSAVGLVAAGLGCLAGSGQPLAVLLGVLGLVSYNAIYTPLKRTTYYAPMIGAVVGAFPPAIGWVSVAGPTFSPALGALMMFFVLWQVPHFWLLLLGATRDYQQAGFLVPTRDLSPAQLQRIVLVWILGTVALAVLLPLFGVVRQPWGFAVVVAAGVWLGVRSARALLVRPGPSSELRRVFAAINGFALATVTVIIIDGTWRRFW